MPLTQEGPAQLFSNLMRSYFTKAREMRGLERIKKSKEK